MLCGAKGCEQRTAPMRERSSASGRGRVPASTCPYRDADPRPLAGRLAQALAADDTLRLRLDHGLQLAFLPQQLDQKPFFSRS